MADYKGVYLGVTRDKFLGGPDSYERDVYLETCSNDALVMNLATEDAKVVQLRVSNPDYFRHFCDALEIGARVCVNAEPEWEINGVVSIKGDIYSCSTVSLHAMQPDGTAAYLCNGYCEASERNEREFGRSGVCDTDAPKLSPDVSGAVKASFLEEVMKLMPANDSMILLRFPKKRDTAGFSFIREDGSYAFFKATTHRKGDFRLLSYKHGKEDAQMLARILMEMQGRDWQDSLGIGYMFGGFSFHGQAQSVISLLLDTEDSPFKSTHDWEKENDLDIWIVSEFEEDDVYP